MKKILGMTALAVSMGVSHSANAEVTLYGLIDSGVEYVNNVNATGSSIVKMPSLTGTFPSRFGLRGGEDLGGGNKAVFVLESGFAPDTGSMGQGNRLFGRLANVGLQGGFGTVTLGRIINMTYLSTGKSDVMGPNIHSIGSLDGYLPNARSDNAISYLGNFSNFTVGATYSFGRDTSSAGGPAATNCPGEMAGNSKACRQVTALVGYDNKYFGLTGAYDNLYGGPTASGGLSSSDYSVRRLGLHGYTMINDVKIGLGGINRKTETATSADANLIYLGVSYPISSALTLDSQVSRMVFNGTGQRATLATARLTYALSKRTAVYTSVGRISNTSTTAIAIDAGGSVGAGMNQLGVMAGLRHTF